MALLETNVRHFWSASQGNLEFLFAIAIQGVKLSFNTIKFLGSIGKSSLG
jgi:hypothetical protein